VRDDFKDEVRYMEELRSRDSLDLLSKDQKIIYLEEKVTKLSKLEKDIIPFEDICAEAKINYDKIKTLSYSNTFVSNFSKIDTLAVFNVTWEENMTDDFKEKEKTKLFNWLKYKLKLDTLVVK
jgi:Leucine-rich repeat (LRR) protein